MQQPKTPQGDRLRSSMNAEERISPELNSELMHREQIPNTPFWILGNQEKGYFLAIGKNKCTVNYPTIEEAKEQINIQPMNLTCAIAAVVCEDLIKSHQIAETIDENTVNQYKTKQQ